MMNLTQLAQMLAGINVKEVAKAAEVSEKTIYRIRQLPSQPDNDWRPNVATVEAIIAAMAAMQTAKRAPKRSKVAA